MKIYSSAITGSLKIKGDIHAENYIVQSTVTQLTQSFSSGSTIFGDSDDDTHQFTGSLSGNTDFSFGGGNVPKFLSDFGDNRINILEADSTTAGIGIVDLDGGVKVGIGTLSPNTSLVCSAKLTIYLIS